MSDLCHNCGDCHLGAHAIKCRKELRECIICRALGHTYNFCPRSVHQLDEKYSYFMLCHNCDSWHLPKPCEEELRHCERCQQYGHMVFFCPIDPEPRARTDEQVGAKRQRNQNSGRDMVQPRVAPASEVEQVHPQLLRDIKLYAVKEAFHLLEQHSETDVLTYFARPVLPPLQTMTGPIQHTAAPAAHQYLPNNELNAPGSSSTAAPLTGNSFDYSNLQHIDQHGQGSPTMLPTPASATDPPMSTGQEQTVGVYQTMHDRFERGELAMAQDVQEPRSDSATQSPAPGSVDAQQTPVSKKKATPKPRRTVTRCAPCKKRHMKCKHFDEDGNPTVPGVQPAASGSVKKIPSGMDLVYEPSVGHLVSREEQDSIRIGNGQEKMQNHIAATDQAMMGELPQFDQVYRSYQGGINRLDWLNKSKEHAQSAFVMNSQGPSMMPAAVDNNQQWTASGVMLPAIGLYDHQSVPAEQMTAADQQLERNLAQMLSEEAGFGPEHSILQPVALSGNADVAFMGGKSLNMPESEAKVVAQADGGGTDVADASVADLVEPSSKKKGGGRKRSKAA